MAKATINSQTDEPTLASSRMAISKGKVFMSYLVESSLKVIGRDIKKKVTQFIPIQMGKATEENLKTTFMMDSELKYLQTAQSMKASLNKDKEMEKELFTILVEISTSESLKKAILKEKVFINVRTAKLTKEAGKRIRETGR